MNEPKKYDIKVTAQSFFLPDQSDEENDQYVFAYTVRIENTGQMPAQVISRHWIITDADQQVQEVRGMGVAVMTRISGFSPFSRKRSRCSTPKRCCSSTTARRNPRMLN